MGALLEVTFFLLPFLFVAIVVWIVVVFAHRPHVEMPIPVTSRR